MGQDSRDPGKSDEAEDSGEKFGEVVDYFLRTPPKPRDDDSSSRRKRKPKKEMPAK
jgi:hypothetical protein